MPDKILALDFPTLDLLQEGIWVADSADRLVFVNAAMGRIAGMDAGLLAGRNLLSFPEGTIRHFLGFFNTARESLLPIEYECPVVTPAGAATWQGGWLTPLIEENRYAGMICTVRDISHRKRLQAQQELAELRYRSVVEDQTEVISRFLPDGTFVFVNEVFCRLFGKSAEELIGKVWHPVAHPDDVPLIQARLNEMSPDNPVVTIENRVCVDGGELRWMQFVNRGFFAAGGCLTEIQSVGRDITERKQMELVLADREERRDMAVAGSGLALWDWDLTAESIHFSKRWYEILGYPPEATPTHVERWKRLFHPNDLIRVETLVAAYLAGEASILQSEQRVRHNEGHWVTVEATGKITRRDAAGNPMRIAGTALDVSNRKRLNEDGLVLLKQIETLIRDNTPSAPANKADSEALESLTRRERQILGLIAEGMTSVQIGQHLKLSANTIITHRKNLMAKLDLHATAEVTRFAIDQGLLKPKPKP